MIDCYPLARALLFQLDAEKAHHFAFSSLGKLADTSLINAFANKQSLPTDFLGMQLTNPVGLAAGLDKNAEYLGALGKLGFGFVEVGTVTPKPQPGNELPRLFRLPKAKAIINRMGFNNHGVEQMLRNIDASDYDGVLGINIGKNKATPQAHAVDDYILCLEQVYQHAHYVTVNLSSPNTPGLRDLQFGDELVRLLSTIKEKQLQLSGEHGRYVPIAVKIAPDMAMEDIVSVTENLLEAEIDAVIATNTTIDKHAVKHLKYGEEQGGLSGLPVQAKSTEVIRQVKQVAGDKLPIIGVGGIDSGKSAAQKVKAGASVVQVYTGFIYRGPRLIEEAVEGIEAINKKARI